MRKITFYFILILVVKNQIISAQIDPAITAIINSVSIDSLYENLNYLTGEKSVVIPSGTQFILSRAYSNSGNFAAEEYLQLRLKKYGLETSLQTFDAGGGNVLGKQRGIKKPNQSVIICAHFDSKPYTGSAPGADDNGSGTSAVLEAARILSKFQTDYSIVYALWNNEETGLNGSSFYTQQAFSNKDSIVAVINMDMIAWDSNNDNLAEIHSRDVQNSNQIAGKMLNINSNYGLGLNLAIINPGTGASDHASFWNKNYSAVLLIENYSNVNGMRDFNSYYHSSLDNIQHINKIFFEKCAKLSIATLASYAVLQTTSSVENIIPNELTLYQNYPNPFNPSTVINYKLSAASFVTLKVYDSLGREITTLVSKYQQPGAYSTTFGTSHLTLSSGVYFYTLYTGDNLIVRKMVLTK